MASNAPSYLLIKNLHTMSMEDASRKGVDVEQLAFV